MNYSAVLMKNSHPQDATDDQTNATTDAKVDSTNSNENDVIKEDSETLPSDQNETVFIGYIRKRKPKSNHKNDKEVTNGLKENSNHIINSKNCNTSFNSTKDIEPPKEHEYLPNNESSEKSAKSLDFHLDMGDRATSSLSSADGGPCSLQEELQMSGEYHQSVESCNGNIPHAYTDSALKNDEIGKYDEEKMPLKTDLKKTDVQSANDLNCCRQCLKSTESIDLQAVSTQCALESAAVSKQCTAESTTFSTESQFREIFRYLFLGEKLFKRKVHPYVCSVLNLYFLFQNFQFT